MPSGVVENPTSGMSLHLSEARLATFLRQAIVTLSLFHENIYRLVSSENRFVTTTTSIIFWGNLLRNLPRPLFATAVHKYARTFSLPLSISLFSNSQPKNQINSKILCLQSPSFLVPRPCQLREAKRAIGTRMNDTKITPSSPAFCMIRSNSSGRG